SVGVVLLPLVLIALILGWVARGRGMSRMRWFWLALMITPLVLSAGASIAIGDTQIPMPYTLFHDLFGGMFRYPERFEPVFLIPAVLFATMTLTAMLSGRKVLRIVIPIGLFLLVAADNRLYVPDAIQPIPYHYSFYDVMGKE